MRNRQAEKIYNLSDGKPKSAHLKWKHDTKANVDRWFRRKVRRIIRDLKHEWGIE